MLRVFAVMAVVASAVGAGRGFAASSSGSDWAMQFGNAQQTSFASGEQSLRPGGLHLLWRLSGPTNYVVAQGQLFANRVIGRGRNAPAAYDVRTGALRRVYRSGEASYPREMAYASGVLYVGGPSLTAVNVATGRVLWRTALSHPAGWGFPVPAGRTVLTRVSALGRDDVPYAIDAASGRILWRGSYQYASEPTVLGSTVSIPYNLLARPLQTLSITYNLRTGRVLHRLQFPTNPFLDHWLVAGKTLVLAADGVDAPLAIDVGTSGAARWRNDHFLAMAAAYGRVYGIDVPHPVHEGNMLGKNLGFPAAIDAGTGHLLWMNRGSGLHYHAGPGEAVVANGTLYLTAGQSGGIAAFDARTGKELARIAAPPGVALSGDLGVADGMLFATGGRINVLGSYQLFAYGR